jgi:hypothetical protein
MASTGSAISSLGEERSKIYWVGKKPTAQLLMEFSNRELQLETMTLPSPITAETTERLAAARGVIVQHDSNKLSQTIGLLREFIKSPLQYSGTKCSVILASPSDINQVLSMFPGMSDLSKKYGIQFPHFKNKGEYAGFAHDYFKHSSIRAPNFKLRINSDITLDPAEDILIRRSFDDCVAITVRKMSQGFSAKVVQVFADFGDGQTSRRALPFLVKLDKSKDVEREVNNFHLYISHFVPFNLRPNLDRSRSFFREGVESEQRGILVANYVDRAVSLLEAIERGGGPSALHCLFEDSLSRWLHDATKRCENLALALSTRVSLETLHQRQDVLSLAKGLGSKLKPETLVGALMALPCDAYRSGMCHKDLHANNVLVRGTDAIVIDFPNCEHGPILTDLATLDVSIAFHSIQRNEDVASDELDAWIKFVSAIFSCQNICGMPPRREGYEVYAKQWSCIRQIRRLALSEQVNPIEYGICLAFELLRRSMFVDHLQVGTAVAGHAYYLCEKLVTELRQQVVAQ